MAELGTRCTYRKGAGRKLSAYGCARRISTRRPHRLYLRGDGNLTASGPGGAPRSYVYDPRQPIPTLGGRNMLIDAGPRDQRPVQGLPHYGLMYRGEVLAEDLTIAGAVRVTLHVQSNCRDTDFV